MHSILVAFNDSVSSWAVIDFLAAWPFGPSDHHLTLLHFFRQPSASEDLMGKKFKKKFMAQAQGALNRAKAQLVEKGFNPNKIEIQIIEEPFPTLADGILEQCRRKKYDLVIIGRKKMSKAEEFVMGDASIKLIRSLEGMAVLVVKSK